jgi:hypothetical protein
MMFSQAMLIGCLVALRWLFWLVSVLLLVLIVMQFVRREVETLPLGLAGFAVFCFLAGWLSGLAARWVRSSGH